MGTKDWEQWALIGQQLAKHGNSKSQSASKSWWGQAGTWREGGGEGGQDSKVLHQKQLKSCI